MEDMFERMRAIICEYSGLKPEEITPDTNIRYDLGLNSLELISMATAIEDEFEVEIPDREVIGLETVADAIGIVKKFTEMEEED